MRAFLALSLAFCLAILPIASARAQAPSGAEPVPGYRGLYVANASRFMAGAFLVAMLTQPKDVRAFLGRVRNCTSSRPMASRLGAQGVRARVIPLESVPSALRAETCTVFIGTNFNLSQLDRPLNSNDPTPTPPEVDLPQHDDVAVDQTPPSIEPRQQVFESTGRTVKVVAKIVDRESGVGAAVVVMPDGQRVTMSGPQNGSTYSATVALPKDFDDQRAIIVATNTAKRSARVRVGLRLLPWCGPRQVVSRPVVQDVQENLACVGISTGGADGSLGPNTCRAIGGYLSNRMSSFNTGNIRWADLQRELRRACVAAQPVELDIPPLVEVDRDRADVRVNLRQPGTTQSIRVTAPGGGTQTQVWSGQPMTLNMLMPPPGQDASYGVQAIGPTGAALARATLRLVRPAAILSLSPSGTVTVGDDSTDFTATVTSGASAVVRIEARLQNAGSTGKPYSGGSEVLSLRAPAPGTSQNVTFVALDRSGNPLARQVVTLTRPELILPTRLTIESPDGTEIDAALAILRVFLEHQGAAQELVIFGGTNGAELARVRAGDKIWDTKQTMPPPGQSAVFRVQAVDGTGKVLVEDEVQIDRTPVRMQVDPTGLFETDTDGVTVQAQVTTGAAWIEAVVARAADTGSILGQTALANGRALLRLDMPQPGGTQLVEIVAMGRDGQPYAPAQITLARPAPTPAAEPVSLLVTSPDGLSIDAANTRLSVRVVNPAETAVIVVSNPDSGQELQRILYTGDDWLGQVAMPEPGQGLSLVIEAQSQTGVALARSMIMLQRPAAVGLDLLNWDWIAWILLGTVGVGAIGPKVYKFLFPAPRPSILAKPDHVPSIEIYPSSPPSLVMHVEEDTEPDIEIDFETDDGASQ